MPTPVIPENAPSKYLSVSEVQEQLDELLDWVNEVKGRVYIRNDKTGEYDTVMIGYEEGVWLKVIEVQK